MLEIKMFAFGANALLKERKHCNMGLVHESRLSHAGRNNCRKTERDLPKWWEMKKQLLEATAGGSGIQRVAITPKEGEGIPLQSIEQGHLRAEAAFTQVSSPGWKWPKSSFHRTSGLCPSAMKGGVSVGRYQCRDACNTIVRTQPRAPWFVCCLLLGSELPWRSQHFGKHHHILLPTELFSPVPLRERVTLKRKKKKTKRRYMVLTQPSWFFFPCLNEFWAATSPKISTWGSCLHSH